MSDIFGASRRQASATWLRSSVTPSTNDAPRMSAIVVSGLTINMSHVLSVVNANTRMVATGTASNESALLTSRILVEKVRRSASACLHICYFLFFIFLCFSASQALLARVWLCTCARRVSGANTEWGRSGVINFSGLLAARVSQMARRPARACSSAAARAARDAFVRLARATYASSPFQLPLSLLRTAVGEPLARPRRRTACRAFAELSPVCGA